MSEETKQQTLLRKRMVELFETDKSGYEIAKVLNSEGFRTPGGSDWSQSGVSRVMIKMGLRKKRKHKRPGARTRAWTSVVPSKSKESDVVITARDRERERDALADIVLNAKFLKKEEKKVFLQLLW